jgi:hypothetical protein
VITAAIDGGKCVIPVAVEAEGLAFKVSGDDSVGAAVVAANIIVELVGAVVAAEVGRGAVSGAEGRRSTPLGSEVVATAVTGPKEVPWIEVVGGIFDGSEDAGASTVEGMKLLIDLALGNEVFGAEVVAGVFGAKDIGPPGKGAASRANNAFGTKVCFDAVIGTAAGRCPTIFETEGALVS